MALDMALDQVSQPVLQGFAKGGLVKNPISAGIASLGRGGDRMLAHITPREARMLMRAGGAGTINPVTGLPEFFIKRLAKAVGRGFKSVGKAVSGAFRGLGNAIKKFAKSTVGRIVTSVALGFLLGPAAASMLGITSSVGVAAIGGFIGSAGSTLLAGGSVSEALKAGAMGGITAGAFSGVTGGVQAFKAGSYTGPTTVSGSWQQVTESLGGKSAVDATKGIGAVDDAAAASKAAGVADEAAAASKAAGAVDEAAAAGKDVAGLRADQVSALDEAGAGYQPTAGDAVRSGTKPMTETVASGQAVPNYMGQADEIIPSSAYGGKTAPVNILGKGTPTEAMDAARFDVIAGKTPGPVTYSPTATYPGAPQKMIADLSNPQDALAGIPSVAGGQLDEVTLALKQAPAGTPATSGGVMDLVKQGEFVEAGKAAGTKLGNLYDEYLSPSGIQQRGSAEALNKTKEAFPGLTTEQIINAPAGSVIAKTYEANLPGMLATYGPLVGTIGGAAYLGGAFDVEEPPKPDIPVSGAELYRRDPYYLTPNVRTVSASTGTPYRYATGGVASLARGTSSFPRKTGPIDGPGTGTSDSIPAMLSDGEFVFTAKAVRAMGGGSRRKGAKRMYALMKALEKRV
jgi:hypothetical protein